METLFKTWIKNENELTILLSEIPNITESEKHKIQVMQIKHQRDELKAIKNELKNRKE